MTVREMTAQDYPKLYELWTSCKGMGLNEADDSEEGITKFLNRNPGVSFVAEEDDRLVGTILVGQDGRRGYIYHTAVAEDRRGQGIGTALLNAAMEALDREGIVKAALVVLKPNDSGNRFWEKQGFFTREDLNYRNKMIREVREFFI